MLNSLTKSIRLVIADSAYLRSLQFSTLMEQLPRVEVIGRVQPGLSSLDALFVLEPELALLDVEEHGLETVSAFVASHPKVKVLVFAERLNPETLGTLLAAGAAGCCLKDTDQERLSLAIATVRAGDLFLDGRLSAALIGACVTPVVPIARASVDVISPVAAQMLERAESLLTERDRDVLKMVAAGATNRQIAQRLFLSVSTVKASISKMLEIFRVDDRTEVAVLATKYGLIR